MKPKPQRFWAVVTPHGRIDYQSLMIFRLNAKLSLRLQHQGVGRVVRGGQFRLRGATAKGAEHDVVVPLDDISSLMCAIGKLSERVKDLVDNERHTHRWARSKLAAAWRELDAAVGKEAQP